MPEVSENVLRALEGFLSEVKEATGRGNFTDRHDWHGRSSHRLQEVREALAKQGCASTRKSAGSALRESEGRRLNGF